MSRDWDVVVVGLGALGSADRLLGVAPARDARPGPRAVRDRPPQRRVRGREPDHPPLLPPARLRAARPRAPTSRGPRSSARAGSQVVFRTGGLDVGPRVTAPGVAIDIGEYARAMTAEGVPFERLDGPEIMRRWPAWRLDDGHVGLFQADAGLADPSAGNVAHRRLAAAHGRRRSASTHRSRGSRAATARRPWSSRTARRSPPARSWSRPTPGRTTSSTRWAPTCR